MTIRYAPQTLTKIKAYRADLQTRAANGAISEDELRVLLTARQQAAFEQLRAEPKRLTAVCEACGATTPTIGDVKTFVCPCSPTVERDVWDSRKP